MNPTEMQNYSKKIADPNPLYSSYNDETVAFTSCLTNEGKENIEMGELKRTPALEEQNGISPAVSNEIIQVSLRAPHANPLINVIFENCLEKNHLPAKSTCVDISRIGLKLLTFCFSVAGCVSNIAVAMKFGGKNRTLGYSVVCANFTSRTSLCSWSYHHIIEGELGREAKIKKRIVKKIQSWYTKASIVTGVFVVAIVAQTPRVYLAYIYNNKKIIYPILNYMALTAIPAYSLYLSTQSILEKNNLTSFESLMSKIKGDIEAKIRSCRKKLTSLSQKEREEFLKFMTSVNAQSKDDCVIDFISKISTQNLPPNPQTRLQKIKKTCSNAFGHLLATTTTAAQLYYYYQIAAAASHIISDDPAFKYATGALVLVSNVQLTTKVMFNSSHKLSQQIFYNPRKLLTGEGITSTIRPKIRTFVEMGTIAISALSTGTTVKPVRDNFKGDLYDMMVIMAPLSIFLLGRNAMNDFVEDIGNAALLSCGESTTEKELIELDQSFKTLDFIIKNASFKNFAKLLDSLPDNIYSNLVKVDVTKEQLRSYIHIS